MQMAREPDEARLARAVSRTAALPHSVGRSASR